MKTKSNLSKITLALILSGMSFMAFANSNIDLDKDKLSQIRMKIQEETLNQELEQGKLNKLRIQQEQSKIKNEINGGSIQLKEDNMNPKEEDILSKENNLPQNVGFIYKSQLIEKENSTNRLDNLNDVKNNNSDEISNILQKFDDLKKESDVTLKSATEYKIVKTLIQTELDMLSIYDENKSAKIRFSYIHDDGIQKRKVITVINATEGKSFKVEDDIYKVENIDSDGIVIRNMNNKEEIILTKNS